MHVATRLAAIPRIGEYCYEHSPGGAVLRDEIRGEIATPWNIASPCSKLNGAAFTRILTHTKWHHWVEGL